MKISVRKGSVLRQCDKILKIALTFKKVNCKTNLYAVKHCVNLSPVRSL